MIRSRFLSALCAAIAATTLVPSLAPPAGAAADYKVDELKESPPEGLSPEMRAALGKSGFRVTSPAGKVVCDIWLRDKLPVLEKFGEKLDMKYPIDPGTLVGAVRYGSASSDYRKQAVKAGVYTLRYGHQPQDGNHIGTAVYRDFLILAPIAQDKAVDGVSQDKAMDWSKKVAGTTHPAIISLLPPQKGRDPLPAMVHEDTLDLEVLVAKTTTAPGAQAKEIQIELVAVGYAPE